MYAKGSNLIGDAAYEERATVFGRSLNRDSRTDKELLDEALNVARRCGHHHRSLGRIVRNERGKFSSRTNLDLPRRTTKPVERITENRKAGSTGVIHWSSAYAKLGTGTRARYPECMVRR